MLNKAIAHGKEHRKPYYKSGRFDRTCRPNGGCPWCLGNRYHKHLVRMDACDAQLKELQDYERSPNEDSITALY